MAVHELKKNVENKPKSNDSLIDSFISQGGAVKEESKNDKKDHRLTLRIPKWLLDKVDEKRKERVGSISRNLWILELIEKATKK